MSITHYTKRVHVLAQKIYNLSYLTGFLVTSTVSDLSNFIVCVTASMLLVGEVQGERLDLDTPP